MRVEVAPPFDRFRLDRLRGRIELGARDPGPGGLGHRQESPSGRQQESGRFVMHTGGPLYNRGRYAHEEGSCTILPGWGSRGAHPCRRRMKVDRLRHRRRSDGIMREASYEPPPAIADDARYSLETRLIRTLLHAFGNPPIAFSLWNGDKIAPLGSAPVATLHITDRRTLLRLCTDPDLQFGELYSAGKIDVDGSILRMIEELYVGAAEAAQPMSFRRRLAQWRHRRTRNTLNGSRENIHHHYDIGNEFYSLWLGETMAYTCAYFPTPSVDARPGADREDGSRLPQGSPESRRARRRGRLRLGRAGAAHGAPLRREGARVQYFARADRVRAGARQGAGSRERGRVRRGRLSQHHGPLRQVRLRRHARARRRGELSRARARHPRDA